jgi:spore coat polysaccharide biosynthesis protein SpsF
MNIVVIVQARTSSTRLPGKILYEIFGKPLLLLQLERIRTAKMVNNIVVATTTDISDDPIIDLCKNNGFDYYRGKMNDLLDRHYKSAIEYNADIVVKIPSDCPLIDPSIIDKVINYYLNNINLFDFVSNLHPPSYPDGNDVEVIPIQILKIAWKQAEKQYELEHTTPYIWTRPNIYRIGNVLWDTGLDYSKNYRFTIDYLEDFEFIKEVYENLYPSNKIFSLDDILNLLEKEPRINKINSKYHGEYWYRNYIDELKKSLNFEQTEMKLI